MVRRVRQIVAISSFFQFLPESKQSFCSVPSLQSELSEGMLHHIAACRKSVGSIIAISWIHVNLEEKEVLVSQVTNIPKFHLF